MDHRWFKEDREHYEGSALQDQMEKSEKALRSSTLLQRRALDILEDMIEETHRKDEDLDQDNWERKFIGNVARRKCLKEVIKLLDF